MNDELTYIATPRTAHRAEPIAEVLERRMKEFMLARRRKIWTQEGR